MTILALIVLWLCIGILTRIGIGICIPNWVSWNLAVLAFEIAAWPYTLYLAIR